MTTVKKPPTKAELRERKLLRLIRAEVKSAAAEAIEARPYRWGYSILTIHFAEGSEPLALSVPYKPWENQADISVPLRVVASVEHSPSIEVPS